MWEKLVAFMFTGILGTMFYHLITAGVLHRMLARSDSPFTWWYVPLIVIPALLLAVLAWFIGFGRRGSTMWGNLGACAIIALIIFCTVGAPYNCWNQFCF